MARERKRPDRRVYKGCRFTGFHMYCIERAVNYELNVRLAEQAHALAAAQLKMKEGALNQIDKDAKGI